MWKTKYFKTIEEYKNWITANSLQYQIVEIFVNNGLAVQFKPLTKI